MFDPKSIFPIVKRSMPNAPDDKLITALSQLAQAHPDLNGMQALAAIQQVMPKQQTSNVQKYLGGDVS